MFSAREAVNIEMSNEIMWNVVSCFLYVVFRPWLQAINISRKFMKSLLLFTFDQIIS